MEDIIGKQFGRLTVVSINNRKQLYKCGKPSGGLYYYDCRCTCGNKCVKSITYLTHTKVPSCGCYAKEILVKYNKENKVKHGWRNTRLYREWRSMKSRCCHKSVNGYKNYGGRGIEVCNEWKNDFTTFKDWAISNGYNDNLSLDRIDVNGNYEPDNCRWVSLKEQGRNRRNNNFITFGGETHCLSEWAEILSIDRATLYNRIYRSKWTIERAFTEPIHLEKRRDNNGSDFNSSK